MDQTSGAARRAISAGDRDDYAAKLRRRFRLSVNRMARHYARCTYGSNRRVDPDKATPLDDPDGISVHVSFYELRYLVEHEWVRSLDDAIWRRNRRHVATEEQQARISEWLAQHAGKSELSLKRHNSVNSNGACRPRFYDNPVTAFMTTDMPDMAGILFIVCNGREVTHISDIQHRFIGPPPG